MLAGYGLGLRTAWRLQPVLRPALLPSPPAVAHVPTPPSSTTNEAIFFLARHGAVSGIFRIAPDGSQRHWLADTPDLLHPNQYTLSADARRMAYLATDTAVAVMDTDGVGDTRLTPPGADWPCISPDGRAVAFTVQRSLYRIDTDGRHLQTLTSPPKDYVDYYASWSPDSRLIAFLRAPADTDSSGGIYIMQADGTRLRRLGPDSTEAPIWSPDGRMLTSEWVELDGSDGAFSLVDAGTGRVLLHKSHAYGVAFNSKGQWIAFHDTRKRHWSIALIHPDGTGRRGVPKSFVMDNDPLFSPDGRELLVTRTSDISPAQERLVRLSLDGSRRTVLTNGWDTRWVRIEP